MIYEIDKSWYPNQIKGKSNMPHACEIAYPKLELLLSSGLKLYPLGFSNFKIQFLKA
jgi:hypothetical protein